MDQATLVGEEIEAGKQLLDHFRQAGFPVTVAGWVWETERGRWKLYVASPVVKNEGIDASDRIRQLLREMPQPFLIDSHDVRPIEPDDPFAEAMLDLRRRNPARSFFRLGGSQFGRPMVEVEAVYVYPPPAVAVQAGRPVSEVK